MKINEVISKNIFIALPKKIKWKDYKDELYNAENGQEMLFKVPFLPKHTSIGNRCYVIWRNKCMGWMKVSNLYSGKFTCTTTGKKWDGNFIARTGKFNYVNDDVHYDSFRGFKYEN